MRSPHSPLQNRLLAALPSADFNRLTADLELMSMPLGKVLHESGGPIKHAYFPTTSILSLQHVLENGAPAGIALVGREGMLGISLFMGSKTTPSRAVVQSAGHAYRIQANLLKQEFNRTGTIMRLLLRYTKALMTQMAQTAVCYRHHSIDQQLCRWLLSSLDRLPSNSLVATQELIANTLGVRRGSITEAAGKLQKAGLIRYSRGRIEVLDRPGLEISACECRTNIRLGFKRMLTDMPNDSPSQISRRSRSDKSAMYATVPTNDAKKQ